MKEILCKGTLGWDLDGAGKRLRRLFLIFGLNYC